MVPWLEVGRETYLARWTAIDAHGHAGSSAVLRPRFLELANALLERLQPEHGAGQPAAAVLALRVQLVRAVEIPVQVEAAETQAFELPLNAGEVHLQTVLQGYREPLLDAGFRPVVFCRYIATAHYLAEHLGTALPGATLVAVTGYGTQEDRRAAREADGLTDREARYIGAGEAYFERRFDDALATIVAACRRHDVVPGIHSTGALTPRRREQGFQMITGSATFRKVSPTAASATEGWEETTGSFPELVSVGVDVERLDRAEQVLEVAETVFSTEELEALAALGTKGRVAAITAGWRDREAGQPMERHTIFNKKS